MYEQMEMTSGYLFYMNKQTGEQQNDNPQFLEIMKTVREKHKTIKYITYRCATKIWFLKQSFYTVNIPCNLVTSVLNHHGFTQCDNAPTLKPTQLTALLHDIYFAAQKCDLFAQSVDFQLERCTAMLANFFWNIFDPNRTVSISLLEFKQLMLILCNTQHFEQLTAEEFNLAADHNRCVNRFRFESLIKVVSKFFMYLEENAFFRSQSISEIIQECFEQSPGMIGLNELQFVGLWKKQHISFSNYSNVLALIYRVKESQNIVHDTECVSCKQSPMLGIRFKCQQCKKIELCFECFCTGYKSSKHELTHRMYEISTNVTKNNVISSTFTNFGKWFCCAKKANRGENCKNLTMETKVTDDQNIVTNTTLIDCINGTKLSSNKETKLNHDQMVPIRNDNQTYQEQINTIASSLVKEAEEFRNYIALSKKQRKQQKPEFLGEHKIFLENITKQLRCMNVPKSMSTSTLTYIPHSSTPYRSNNNRKPLAFSIGSQLANSIYGTELSKSYLDDNRSDWTLADISTLLQSKSHNISAELKNIESANRQAANPLPEGGFEAEMQNFKELLNKIREIMDDSFSENTELSSAAKKLENALDTIIDIEENKRK